jgi:hypothetical protein
MDALFLFDFLIKLCLVVHMLAGFTDTAVEETTKVGHLFVSIPLAAAAARSACDYLNARTSDKSRSC